MAGSVHSLTTAAAAALLVAGLAGAPAASFQTNPSISQTSSSTAAQLRKKGVELGYNLDHAAALAVFEQAIAADPTDPAAYRLVAATMWINLLFRQGAVTAEDFLGQAMSTSGLKPKAADLDGRFRESLRKAIALAEARLRDRGESDVDGHYQIGAAYGFLASYTATVEGSMMGALGPSRRAYSEHSRVLELDPARKDAGLIVGLYRYGVSTLGFFSRMVANIAGFNGGRERGIRLVEEAASAPSDVQTNAKFSLVVLYNRERRYAEALRIIQQLQEQFPRNRLLWLEAAGTALRSGRPAEANAAIERGLAMLAADSRPRAFGETARWHYQHGLSLAAMKLNAAAETEFRAALTTECQTWLRGRTYLELGKLASRASGGTHVPAEARQAVNLCSAAKDELCVKEARALMRRK